MNANGIIEEIESIELKKNLTRAIQDELYWLDLSVHDNGLILTELV